MSASFDYLPTLLAVLQADSTLTTALTGGIYLKRALRGGVLTRQTTPAAYNADKEMKPLLIVKARSAIPFGPKDPSNQYRGIRQGIEFWLQNDAGAGATAYAPLRIAANRLYALLQDKQIAGAAKWQYAGELEFNDPALNGAATILKEFLLIGSRRAS